MDDFFRPLRAANSTVPGRILSNFKPIQDFMVVLVTYKNEEDPIKNEGARVVTRFSQLYIVTLCELSVAMETRVTI